MLVGLWSATQSLDCALGITCSYKHILAWNWLVLASQARRRCYILIPNLRSYLTAKDDRFLTWDVGLAVSDVPETSSCQ